MSKKVLVAIFLIFVLFLGVLFIIKQRTNLIEVGQKLGIKDVIDSPLEIGYITDLHCYSKQDNDTGEWDINWRCTQPMTTFVQKMINEFQPDILIDGGDLVDGRDGQEKNLYPVVMGFFKQVKDVPAYHILGNHETRGFTKEEWLGFTGYKKTYYYKDVREYRLIFLDGNNKPDAKDGSIPTSPENEYYPGFLDTEQEQWLKETLEASRDRVVLVFVHQPPLEKTILKKTNDLFINGDKIRKLFSENEVRAVFSGHIEETCFIKEGGVDYYALEGSHKGNRQLLEKDDYKDRGVFYQISLDEDHNIQVEMFHKDREEDEYQSLIVNKETAICNNQSVQNPEEYKALVDQEEMVDEDEEEEED